MEILNTTLATPEIIGHGVFSGIKDSRVFDALEFCIQKHRGQTRKYTEDPYVVHPLNVAILVNEMCVSTPVPDIDRGNMIVAALLHDTVEDCEVTFEEIYDKFGDVPRDLVYWLTDPFLPLMHGKSNYNRAERKRLSRAFFSCAPEYAVVIKACDILDNSRTILLNDKGFAPLFIDEVMSLYSVVSSKLERWPRLKFLWKDLRNLHNAASPTS